ncbi:hypothetical protein BJ508DRAFT_378055 [Ascobolus immersus RN42]|uniref:Uncharacterized protein n=1 Tax=Ascobolus immersus RN42 TaxID=1160509 RepID=A0A3N4I413_ASCIM|nr:hypothetical protein BJ508DRAFT_378055 [Ascobolus immersus RN42]
MIHNFKINKVVGAVAPVIRPSFLPVKHQVPASRFLSSAAILRTPNDPHQSNHRLTVKQRIFQGFHHIEHSVGLMAEWYKPTVPGRMENHPSKILEELKELEELVEEQDRLNQKHKLGVAAFVVGIYTVVVGVLYYIGELEAKPSSEAKTEIAK